MKAGVLNRAVVVVSTGLRASAQMIVFLMLARAFLPNELGRFSLFIAISGICALIGEFGSGTFALPMLARVSGDVRLKFVEILKFKLLSVTLAILVGAVVGVAFISKSPSDTDLMLICFAIGYASVFSEYFLYPFRAIQAYRAEAVASIFNSVVLVISVAVAIFWSGSIFYVACAYLFSRILAIGVAWVVFDFELRKRVDVQGAGVNDGGSNRVAIVDYIKIGFPFLIDSLLTSGINYADTFLVSTFIGVSAVGVYQIPSKMMQASLLVVQVVSIIYIPSLSRLTSRKEQRAMTRRMVIELAFVALVAFAGASLVVPEIVARFFNAAYSLPRIAWIGFGAAIAIRLISAGYGIFLVSAMQPKVRIIGQVLILSTFVIGVVCTSRYFELVGVAWSFALAMAVAFIYYRQRVRSLLRAD